MKPWLMAIIGRQRQLVTETFTSNSVWVAGPTTNKIETLSGKGAAGRAASSGTLYYREDTTIILYRYPGGGSDAVGPTLVSRTISYSSAPLPGDYCDPEEPYTSITTPPGTTRQKCYYFDLVPEPFDRPATTGASATGFGSTFPGGVGGPAPTTTIASPPAVLPGASYTLVIPAGGSITFSYYK